MRNIRVIHVTWRQTALVLAGTCTANRAECHCLMDIFTFVCPLIVQSKSKLLRKLLNYASVGHNCLKNQRKKCKKKKKNRNKKFSRVFKYCDCCYLSSKVFFIKRVESSWNLTEPLVCSTAGSRGLGSSTLSARLCALTEFEPALILRVIH